MQLRDAISSQFRLSSAHTSALNRLHIASLQDLLWHFPSRYEEAGGEASANNLELGKEVTLAGTLEKLQTKKSWKRKIPISDGYLRDASGRVKLMWFNQPYIAKMYQDGTLVKATGRVSGSVGKLYLANPQLQKISATEVGLFQEKPPAKSLTSTGSATDFASGSAESQKLFAVYPETKGVSSLWFRHAIEKILTPELLQNIEDPIPQDVLDRYHLPGMGSALHWIHAPENLKQAEAARKRFAFEEIFFIQLSRALERTRLAREKGFAVDVGDPDKGRTLPKAAAADFVAAFPFAATKAQTNAIETILDDMRRGTPMSRLLEGDVGSGKTAVAATAAFATVHTRPANQSFGTLQVAYMAPTEILAKQHFESFIKYFEYFPINIGLITGSGCYKFPSKISRDKWTTISRAQLLKWVANGEIPILIGTHALIEKAVRFKHLALVVIDEQHRFGTNQRKKLAHKDARLPHLLSMTATPIPRTLALTLYGDLDLTLLDQMPPGRKPIITKVVPTNDRSAAYEHMRKELADGRQAYIICPRIDEPDPEKAFALQAKSVKEEAKRLKSDVFPEYEIAILHSKMTPKEKDDTMLKFSNHKIDILVATSVVEVGVNVPNATIIFIEGAERFGLAQLHQLRGRVVRSNHQAYCFVCPESRGEKTLARLKSLVTAKNGFELAEQDLLQRGAGSLSGDRQWGISDVGMDALKNLKLVEAARSEAQALVKSDENLARHATLKREVELRTASLHFE